MKRITKILSFICLAVLIFSGARLAKRLPADSSQYVEKKYSGWSGVLRGWIYSDWSCAGSFVRWLNGCAAEFEKLHEGVYIEFETVSREAMTAGDIHPPDMRIFSAGAIDMPATTVAMGGYVFVENPSAAGTAIPAEYAAPMIAMYARERIEVPESGVDLGLPAMNDTAGFAIDPDAFRQFRNGELGRTIVNQSQLAELIALRNAGRGPDWRCVAQGEYAWCDQRLMLGIETVDEARAQLCREFLKLLLSEESQRGLAEIGGFSAAGFSIYGELSAYRAMEQQLLGAQQLFPKSEHSAHALSAIVRELAAGKVSPREAARMLVQTCS